MPLSGNKELITYIAKRMYEESVAIYKKKWITPWEDLNGYYTQPIWQRRAKVALDALEEYE